MPRKDSLSADAWERHKARENARSVKYGLSISIRSAITTACRVYEFCGLDLAELIQELGYRPSPDHHLDHSVPLSVFDSSDPGHLRAAWQLENLKWVPGSVNARKHNDCEERHVIEYFGRHGLTLEKKLPINSRRKGNRWESVVHKILEDIYGPDQVLRGYQFVQEHGTPDRITPELCVEAKHGKRINLTAALAQCEGDAKRRGLDKGRMCVVFAKYDRDEPIAVLRLTDFVDLVKTRKELAER